MSDDDNYTIEEPDEPSIVVAVDDPTDAPNRDAVSVGILIVGLLTIAGAGLCATHANFDNTAPTKTTFFITSLTLPLSITGALLTVIAVCVLAFRLPIPRRGE